MKTPSTSISDNVLKYAIMATCVPAQTAKAICNGMVFLSQLLEVGLMYPNQPLSEAGFSTPLANTPASRPRTTNIATVLKNTNPVAS